MGNDSRKRSATSIEVAQHWANKRSNFPIGSTKESPIIISEEEDSQIRVKEDSTVLAQDVELSQKIISSPIKLLFNPGIVDDEEENANTDAVMMSELIGTKDLKETYQFNFSVDLALFLTYLHPDVSRYKKSICFITGSKLLSGNHPDMEFIKGKFNISEVVAKIPNRYGTHHTKMMINFFEDETVEIVIMTCNFTKLDVGGLTQMIWRSGRLKKKKKDEIIPILGQRFQRDLTNYLRKYHNVKLNCLAEVLKDYSFSPILVELVASAPGSYDITNIGDEDEIYGYGKLYQVLKRNNLLIDNNRTGPEYNILAQVSSIAYPFATLKGCTSSIFTHLLCPLVFSGSEDMFSILWPGKKSCETHQSEFNYKPHIVFPSVEDIAANCVGFVAGQAIHFNYTQSYIHRNQYEQNIKPYVKRWGSNDNSIKTGREKVAPHVKLYMCDNADNWSSLKWVLMCSHNLSKQAWGCRKSSKFTSTDPTEYEISSYELGVLIPGNSKKLIPSFHSDELPGSSNNIKPIRLPFTLPPSNYRTTDQPWSKVLNCGESVKDRFGQNYNLN